MILFLGLLIMLGGLVAMGMLFFIKRIIKIKKAQAQLFQAQKLQVVGELVGEAAHEIKNSLAVMLMGLDYFSQSDVGKNPDFAIVLKNMNKAVKKADVVTKGLSDFANSSLGEKKREVNDYGEEKNTNR